MDWGKSSAQKGESLYDTVKTFEFSETPDAISIQKPDGEIKLVLENEEWFVGEKKYPTLQSTVDSIIDDIKSVRALDKVGKANNQNMLDRYELNDGQKIVVTASLNGKAENVFSRKRTAL